MLKKFLFAAILLSLALVSIRAQAVQSNADTVMILPFENTSEKPEFNWVGESFADSLSDLLKVPSLNVVSNDERKIIQQRLRIPLTSLPSLATSLKLARESSASLLIAGKYNIIPAQGDTAATLNVTAKIIRVNEGRFLNEELPDGRRITRDINLTDALGNLQTIQGQVAYQILYQRDKALSFSQNDLVVAANKVPARAFEAYIKGLLTNDMQARENYFKNAMRLYGEIKSGETYADAALELGHFYLSQRKHSDAIEYFSRLPQNSSLYPEAAFYTGLIQWQQNNYEQALAVLRPLAEDLKLTSVYNTIGAIAVQAARGEKKNQGKSAALLNEGLELLKKAAESSPNESNAKFNYGIALFLNANYLEAAEQLRPVLAANPRDGESYYILAKALEQLKDATAVDIDNQAKRFLTEANKYAKLETEWQRSKAIGDINLRVEQPARKDFVSVVLIKNQVKPVHTAVNETESLLQQAHTLYKNGNDDEAMSVLRRVLASEPMNAESYLILGKIHLRRGDQEQGVSSFKTALFWDNRLIDAHISLGKIYLDKNDCLQAKNYSALALEIDSENQEAVALQRLVERCSK
ncbi:MAG: Bacteriophage receptor, outer rane subunit [Acidobacteria bacterium]|nr:Bacteriophage receptor, outer rane subunit [Acidobacteriota bacterium]